jgi:1-deoxy-D-xylulose-5-phosphate reductoisomerase
MGGIAILGSTGSIGTQAVETCLRFPDRFRVAALSTHRNVDLLARQADLLGPAVVVIADPGAAARAGDPHVLGGATVFTGPDAVVGLATGELATCDTVLNALVGVAGLRATMAALQTGKRLALANKESLVVGGELVTGLVGAAGSQLIPVDSEHSAVFQCLVGEDAREVARIVLTASGGPFRGRTRAELETVTREQALTHPRWSMGPKITIDSATLMNKGLEVIEAHHLFGVGYDRVDVVIHPQSIVHSMVEFVDGSMKAHLGRTDMRIPIQYALSYPERLEGPLPPLDLVETASLSFEAPDPATFSALSLAYAAGRAGGTAPAVLNAANEEAVAAFLDGHCTFLDITDTVASAVEAHEPQPAESVEALFEADAWARELVRKRITWKS